MIEPSDSFATQTESSVAASAFAPSPAGIVAFTIAVEGSTRDTVPSRWFATQIDSNAESTAVGPFPVSLYASVTVRFVGSAGSTRATPAGAIATHTPFGVKATPEGRPASCTVLGSPLEFGSSLMSSAVMESVIQSAPSPNAIPEGAVPTGISSVTSPVPGSIRMTVPSPAFVTHTEPSPIAMPAGDLPTSMFGSVTEPSSRLTRATTPWSGLATHRLPKPIAVAPGRSPSAVGSDPRLPSAPFNRAIEFVPTSIGPPASDRSTGIDTAMRPRTTAIPTPTAQGRAANHPRDSAAEGWTSARRRSASSGPAGWVRGSPSTSVTASTCQVPSTPLRAWLPRSWNPKPSAGDQVARRRSYEDIARAPERHHAGPHDDGDPAELLPDLLALAEVHARADLDAELAHRLGHGARAPYRGRRFGEAREEAVPGRVELFAAEPLQLAPDDRVMAGDQLLPPGITDAARHRGRVHDVGEQDRGEGAGADASGHGGEFLPAEGGVPVNNGSEGGSPDPRCRRHHGPSSGAA